MRVYNFHTYSKMLKSKKARLIDSVVKRVARDLESHFQRQLNDMKTEMTHLIENSKQHKVIVNDTDESSSSSESEISEEEEPSSSDNDDDSEDDTVLIGSTSTQPSEKESIPTPGEEEKEHYVITKELYRQTFAPPPPSSQDIIKIYTTPLYTNAMNADLERLGRDGYNVKSEIVSKEFDKQTWKITFYK